MFIEVLSSNVGIRKDVLFPNKNLAKLEATTVETRTGKSCDRTTQLPYPG